MVGSGKTVTQRRLQQQLMDENKIIVARSLSVDKQSVRLATLIKVLFYSPWHRISRCNPPNRMNAADGNICGLPSATTVYFIINTEYQDEI